MAVDKDGNPSLPTSPQASTIKNSLAVRPLNTGDTRTATESGSLAEPLVAPLDKDSTE